MPTWDPERYLRFGHLRHRPALDLIGAIDLDDPRTIWDLGCGTGAVTAVLAGRWPRAEVHGIDASDEMLGVARLHAGIHWEHRDIAHWEPSSPVDLVFSNAALHWVGDHAHLFARLIDGLAIGGILAVQMPRNFDQPSHTRLAETATSDRWRDRAGHLPGPPPVADPGWYHRLLRPLVSQLDIWETEYLHALTGRDPVAAWTASTAALPYRESLGEDGEAFMEDYAARLAEAYPPDADGVTLFPFRRLFIVATK